MSDYPRYRNGHVDTGREIINGGVKRRCPNCNSDRFRETVSLEHCPACGLRCDYWGGGKNDVYQDMMDREHAAEERRREEEEREEREAEDRWRRGIRDDEEEY